MITRRKCSQKRKVTQSNCFFKNAFNTVSATKRCF